MVSLQATPASAYSASTAAWRRSGLGCGRTRHPGRPTWATGERGASCLCYTQVKLPEPLEGHLCSAAHPRSCR